MTQTIPNLRNMIFHICVYIPEFRVLSVSVAYLVSVTLKCAMQNPTTEDFTRTS